MLSQRGGNWRDDENYNRLLELQFAYEVSACDSNILEYSLTFYECMANFLRSVGTKFLFNPKCQKIQININLFNAY